MDKFHPEFVDAYAFSKESRFKFKISGIIFSFRVFEKSPSYFQSRHLKLFLQEFLRVHKNMYPHNIITKTNDIYFQPLKVSTFELFALIFAQYTLSTYKVALLL